MPMNKTALPEIILIGAGKLAWHLGPALLRGGYSIRQVYSRSEESARPLAEKMGAGWTRDAGELDPEADMLLFCIPDAAIKEFPCFIELKKKLMMVHTAGAVPADVFSGIAGKYGVLYPLMSFTKERKIDWKNIPVCIEGNNHESLAIIEDMAACLSSKICRIDSGERKKLHLAGTIANNFSNHMFHLAAELLHDSDLSFDLLKPLIMETAAKVMEIDPSLAQTGPASRNDEITQAEHADLLKDHPELQKIYTFVSASIAKHFKTP
jgi:predicted short-subunit dehydrogenase-like oxidoreductase (DUF2520 family)